jgi:hypothetical protein
MSRALRIVIASALLVIAAFATFVVATEIGIAYYLPSGSGADATTHVAVFAPAVVATVVAGLATVLLVAHLVVAIRRAVPRWQWIVAAVLTVIAVAAPFVIGTLDRPTF